MQPNSNALQNNEINNISRDKISPFDKRVHEVDFLRGILILIVIMDHIFWNLNHYYGIWDSFFDNSNIFVHQNYLFFHWYWTSALREVVRQFVLFLFCFVSGISCAFSKNNWSRAGLMVGVATLVSVVTNLVDAWGILGQTARIDFNIIHVLAFSILIYCFFQKKTWKSLLAMCLIFIIFSIYTIPALKAIPGSEDAFVPMLWASNSIVMADWLPLFPYIAFFFAGAILSTFIYKDKKSIFKKSYKFERPICFIGRHTLIIYLAHQIIIIPIFMLISLGVCGTI